MSEDDVASASRTGPKGSSRSALVSGVQTGINF